MSGLSVQEQSKFLDAVWCEIGEERFEKLRRAADEQTMTLYAYAMGLLREAADGDLVSIHA